MIIMLFFSQRFANAPAIRFGTNLKFIIKLADQFRRRKFVINNLDAGLMTIFAGPDN